MSSQTPVGSTVEPAAEPEAGGAGEAHDVATALLHEPVPELSASSQGGRFAYRWWGMLLVSLFVAYHASVLLVHNLPNKGLSRDLHRFFDKHLQMRSYLYATGNTQSWAMFAPNPHRTNFFMKVMVVDDTGEIWDLAQDIYGRRRYPYLFYDRMGKINRRIIEQKGYRRHYAAWVCREWERTHQGKPAQEVRFVKMWTRVPPPEAVIEHAQGNPVAMWYDPMQLPLKQREEDAIPCDTTRQAQLPNHLRERYGFEPVDDTVFRPIYIRTWKDRQEAKARAQERSAAKLQIGREARVHPPALTKEEP